jgi:Flp pilus assembly protein TadB
MRSSSKSARDSSQSSARSLSTDAHHQVMDLLKQAENSQRPEIRDAAIQIAKDTSKHRRAQEAKLSPNLVVFLGTLLTVAAVIACWYALVTYPSGVAWSIVGVLLGCLIIVFGLYGLLSGHLSQASFVQIIRMVWARFSQSQPNQLQGNDADLQTQVKPGVPEGTNRNSSHT